MGSPAKNNNEKSEVASIAPLALVPSEYLSPQSLYSPQVEASYIRGKLWRKQRAEHRGDGPGRPVGVDINNALDGNRSSPSPVVIRNPISSPAGTQAWRCARFLPRHNQLCSHHSGCPSRRGAASLIPGAGYAPHRFLYVFL
jgi:hypothetical protein